MVDERDDATRGEPTPAGRVYDIREWAPRPTLRRVGAPRALWARGQAGVRPAAPAPIVPVRHVPVRSAPVVAEAPPAPVLVIGCTESASLERLGVGLQAFAVVRTPGGVAPRSPQGRQVSDGLEAGLERARQEGRPLLVACVGHLGCQAIRTSRRYAPSSAEGLGPEQALRAVEHHVFQQVHRVRTYLRRRGRHPEVRVVGLCVDDATGHVRVFDPARRAFAPLTTFDVAPFATSLPSRAD